MPRVRIVREVKKRQQSNAYIGNSLWLPIDTANTTIISISQFLTDTLLMMAGQHHAVNSQVRQTTLPTCSLQERSSVADSTVGVGQDFVELAASPALQHDVVDDLSQ